MPQECRVDSCKLLPIELMPGRHWLFAVELAVFLVPDCPHLLADHLFGMGDAPLTHPPPHRAQAAEIQARVFLPQPLHRQLACEQGIGHQPRQHQVPTPNTPGSDPPACGRCALAHPSLRAWQVRSAATAVAGCPERHSGPGCLLIDRSRCSLHVLRSPGQLGSSESPPAGRQDRIVAGKPQCARGPVG